MINVGVIGCGKIAQVRHLPEYEANPYCVIAAVSDFNQERASQIAEQYHAKVYGSADELLRDKSIDAVSICVANSAHAELVMKALEAGKHVLCEKPMATTLEDCEAIVRKAKETGRALMIGHNQRFTKAHVMAKRLIASGEIGKPLTFRTTFAHGGPETWTVDSGNVWFFDRAKSAFGAMADLGVHKTDLIQFLTGHVITEATACLATLDKRTSDGALIGVDDNAICIYRMDNGVVGTMTASWTCYGAEDNSTVIYGTDGVIHIYEDPCFSVVVEHRDHTRTCYELDQIQTNDNQTKSGVIDEWIDCLENHREPACSGESALTAMRAVFAALKSSESGRTEKTGNIPVKDA